MNFGVRKVYKKGDSLGITLPVVFTRNAGISEGTKVKLAAIGKKLVMEVVVDDKH